MKSESQLALEAIITGLRRSGMIDRRAVHCVSEVLRETASKAAARGEQCGDGLLSLADALEKGPARSCLSQ